MYSGQKNVIDLHNDVQSLKDAHLEKQSDGTVILHASFVLHPREYEFDDTKDRRIHTTNGINHIIHEIPIISHKKEEKVVKNMKNISVEG